MCHPALIMATRAEVLEHQQKQTPGPNSASQTYAGEIAASKQPCVFMMDLLPTVPYYTGHLCAALQDRPRVEVSLGATTYSHDSTYFTRIGLHCRRALLDIAGRLPSSAKPLRRALKFVEYLLNLLTLSLWFMLSRPDIVHVQFTPLINRGLPFELWFLRWVRQLGCKIVYTVHNVLPHDNGERYRALYAQVYRLVDHFICHDPHAKAALAAEFQVPPDTVSIIPHGPLFSPGRECTPHQARAKTGLSPDACIVLWQGIIRPYKGISFLLKAWKAARQAGLQATLVIVGTGEKDVVEAVAEEVQALDIASSVCLDFRFVSVEMLEAYHLAADILVYPYTAITTSGALMTGMGYGKAMIASALPAFEEMLQNDKNALLVPYGDVDGWAGALARLASDADLRARLGGRLQASRAGAPRWTDIACETLRVYEQVLTASSTSK